jgi:hypothetical protein
MIPPLGKWTTDTMENVYLSNIGLLAGPKGFDKEWVSSESSS